MKLVVSSADPLLARTLYLMAKRLFSEATAPDATLFLLDLDHPDPAVTRQTGAVCVGFSASPDTVDGGVRATLSALLSLPPAVREFDAIVERLFPRSTRHLLICDPQRVLLGGRQIRFSKTEAALFALLYENRERVVSDAEIAAALGDSAAKANTPAVYLYRLRRKLCADGKERIRTVRGKGAQWVGEVALSL